LIIVIMSHYRGALYIIICSDGKTKKKKKLENHNPWLSYL